MTALPEADANGNIEVHPTNSCFDDAAENMAHLCVVKKRTGVVTVHGIVTLNGSKPYSHAWVEHDGQVYQHGVFGSTVASYSIPKEYFEQIFTVLECTRYTFAECLLFDKLLGCPPWKSEYRRLCLDAEESC